MSNFREDLPNQTERAGEDLDELDITEEEIYAEIQAMQITAPLPGDVTTRMVMERLGINKYRVSDYMHRLEKTGRYKIVKVVDPVTNCRTNALRRVR